MEEWREVPNLDGRFIVSTEGRIAEITGFSMKIGYVGIAMHKKLEAENLCVGSLKKGKKYYRGLVHHLVALAFIGPPPDKERDQINHKDGNKANNRPENLEWTTQEENMYHAWSLPQHGGWIKYNTHDYSSVLGLRNMGMTWLEIRKLTVISESNARDMYVKGRPAAWHARA